MHAPRLVLVLTAAATLGLAACDRRDDGQTVGQKVDDAVATAKGATAEVKQSAKEGLDSAAKVSQEKGEEVAKKAGDLAITAAINAGLAKDPDLSPMRINVDTKDGRVALFGSAPNEAAKQRAQQIAMAQNGVSAVDNQLAIEKR